MSLYRCAVCGSARVVEDTENNGFSYGKAAVGYAVFGVVGTVAGINGKKNGVFKCADCGHTMMEPMDAKTKEIIDACVMFPEERAKHNWNRLKSRYPNIESGLADQTIARKANSLQAAIDSVVEEANAELERMRQMTEEELDEDEKQCDLRREAIKQAFNDEAELILIEKKAEIEKKKAEMLAALPEQLKTAQAEWDAVDKQIKKAEKQRKKPKLLLLVTLICYAAAVIFGGLMKNPQIGAVFSIVGFVFLVWTIISALKQSKIKKTLENLKRDFGNKTEALGAAKKIKAEIDANPPTLPELKLPDKETVVKNLMKDRLEISCASARSKINKSTGFIPDEARMDLAILLYKIFLRYADEIQKKKLKQIIREEIPQKLNDQRFKQMSGQSLEGSLRILTNKLDERFVTVDSNADYDDLFGKEFKQIFYRLK